MGKGDKKTRRGKLFQGSFGVRRRKKKAAKGVQVNKARETIIPATEVKTVPPVSQAKAPKAVPAKRESKSKKAAEPAGKDEKGLQV
jgi:30S ribosomal protein S31